MVSPSLCAFDPSGSSLAVTDGDELLVYGGLEDEPRWARTLPSRIVGLGAGEGSVTTYEARGVLSWWSGSGEVYASTTVGDDGLALATARDGQACAVVFPDRVVLVERGAASRTVRIPEATAAAFSFDGGRVAVGTASGRLEILTFAGERLGGSMLEAGVRSLASSPRGSWYAASGDRIVRINATGGEPSRVTRATGLTPDCLCVSDDGTLFAVRLDDHTVIALSDPPTQNVVQLVYPSRTATGLAFGAGRVLGVALDGGDANYVDIPNKELRRTDTFSHREHVRWLVQVGIHPEAAPPPGVVAPSTPPPRATEPSPLRTPTPSRDPAAISTTNGRRSWLIGGLSLALLVVAVYWKVSADQRRVKEERDRQMQEEIEESVRESVTRSMKER